MAPPDDEEGQERDLQLSLRDAAAVVMLVLIALLVLSVVLDPPRSAEATTLILGLGASIVGALLMLLGIQVALNRTNGGK
jgi:hypothetical protein